MRCAICGQMAQPSEACVATREGAIVHIVCADHEAAVAWAWRRWWALLHALAVAVAVGGLLIIGITPWLLGLIGTSVIAHPLIHRRFWRYLMRDFRRWSRW